MILHAAHASCASPQPWLNRHKPKSPNLMPLASNTLHRQLEPQTDTSQALSSQGKPGISCARVAKDFGHAPTTRQVSSARAYEEPCALREPEPSSQLLHVGHLLQYMHLHSVNQNTMYLRRAQECLQAVEASLAVCVSVPQGIGPVWRTDPQLASGSSTGASAGWSDQVSGTLTFCCHSLSKLPKRRLG